jgi:hypothetical protein
MFGMKYTIDGVETDYDTWNSMAEAQSHDDGNKEKKKEAEMKKEQQKKSELSDIDKASVVLNAVGFSFGVQNSLIDLAGKLGVGTEDVVRISKGIGKFTGLLQAGIAGYNLSQNKSPENYVKMGVSLISLGLRGNTFGAVLGILDITGVTEPVYKSIGEIPESINNSFMQMHFQMNNFFQPPF